MDSVDPVALFQEDRNRARDAEDACVDRCVLGTQVHGQPVSMRVLVLRDIDDRLAVFYSSTSSKHIELASTKFKASLLVFFPTIGIQYRIRADLEQVAEDVVKSHWQLKPNAAKRMDSLYRRYPQGTVIADEEQFKTQFAAAVPPVQAPSHSVGYYIEPFEIERLELHDDPAMHDRNLFKRRNSRWEVHALVP